MKKLQLLTLLALINLTGIQASNKEYKNTRKLFASLGLKHTKSLVIEDPRIIEKTQYFNAAISNQIESDLDDLVNKYEFFTPSTVRQFKKDVNENPIRKDLRVQFISDDIGYGVFATTDIPKDSSIGIYTGEVLHKSKSNLDYSFEWSGIDSNNVWKELKIDASRTGNATRFINHDDQSKCNCGSLDIMDKNMIPQTLFVAMKAIKKGEQLTINYGLKYDWKKKAVKQATSSIKSK